MFRAPGNDRVVLVGQVCEVSLEEAEGPEDGRTRAILRAVENLGLFPHMGAVARDLRPVGKYRHLVCGRIPAGGIMSRATVDEILDRIRQLPEEDRVLFDEMLAQQEGQEWREEAAKAQRLAQSRGIDQGAIDRAIHALRNGE